MNVSSLRPQITPAEITPADFKMINKVASAQLASQSRAQSAEFTAASQPKLEAQALALNGGADMPASKADAGVRTGNANTLQTASDMGYSKKVGSIDLPTSARGGPLANRSDVFSTEDGKKFVLVDQVSRKAQQLPDSVKSIADLKKAVPNLGTALSSNDPGMIDTKYKQVAKGAGYTVEVPGGLYNVKKPGGENASAELFTTERADRFAVVTLDKVIPLKANNYDDAIKETAQVDLSKEPKKPLWGG